MASDNRYKQPTTFMDIKETQMPLDQSVTQPSLDEFQDDPTVREVLHQTQQSVGDETSAMMSNDLNEDAVAPEIKEFIGTDKMQSISSENGLAGPVEKAEGAETPEATEIKSLLDRMKELTKIMTNKPDVQWDGGGISSGGLMDAAKEVDPNEVVRADTSTGAPKIELLKQELRPDNPITTSAPKAEKSEGGEKKETKKPWEKDEKKKEGGEKKEVKKPWEKDEKKPEAEEDKKEDDETIDEVTTHNMAAKRRAGQDLNESVMTEAEILRSYDTELLYENMVKFKNDGDKFFKFKRRLDQITKENKLNESLAKMRNRF